MNNDTSIYAEGLTKKFGDFTAVNNISLEVKSGEIFGFLGANGSGKSTTIRMLIGIMKPTSGYAVVGGHNIIENPEMVKMSIGYMSQRFSLYEDLTVKENLDFFGGIYGLDEKVLKQRVQWALGVADLNGKENIRAFELPGGWKQKLALSCALLHKPKIVFLDEPTSGVDPISRRNFWNLIQSITDEGVTAFVTTHYLEEAEYCNNLAFIHNGSIVIQGTPPDLKKNVIKQKVFEIEGKDPNKLIDCLKQEEFVDDISIFGLKVHIIPRSEDIDKNFIAGYLKNKYIEYTKIDEIVPSLEDVFIELIKLNRENA